MGILLSMVITINYFGHASLEVTGLWWCRSLIRVRGHRGAESDGPSVDRKRTRGEGPRQVRAVVRSWSDVVRPVGVGDRGEFLYLGPADTEFELTAAIQPDAAIGGRGDRFEQ